MLEIVTLLNDLKIEWKFVDKSDDIYVIFINENSEYFTGHSLEELQEEIDMKIEIAQSSANYEGVRSLQALKSMLVA